MNESTEAKWLRANWNSETLRRFENQWIAVIGEGNIVANVKIDLLREQIAREYSQDLPLYAFIYFGPIQ
jgi:hypothetical protein